VEGPGLFKCAPGTKILPTSCTRAAYTRLVLHQRQPKCTRNKSPYSEPLSHRGGGAQLGGFGGTAETSIDSFNNCRLQLSSPPQSFCRRKGQFSRCSGPV